LFEFSINSIIGHRGCDELKYSNTIEAFLKGIELGADMIEFDVRRTKDGVLIVYHDEDVFGKNINENNYEFLKLFALKKDLQIPTLKETLVTLKGKTHPVVEIKEEGYEINVVKKIKEYFSVHDFVVISFIDKVIKKIKVNFPEVTAGLLLGDEYVEMKKWNQRINHLSILFERYKELFPWKKVKKCKADFIVPYFELLHLGLLKSSYNRNIPVFVWTVNKQSRIKNLIKSKLVNGIISDKPGLVYELIMLNTN